MKLRCNLSTLMGSRRYSIQDVHKMTGLSRGTTVSKSGTITINDFNGFDPSGKWKIWIVTKGTVSTSTETIKVYYTY